MSKSILYDDLIVNAVKTRFNNIAAGDDYHLSYANKVHDNKAAPFSPSDNTDDYEINLREYSEDVLDQSTGENDAVIEDRDLDVAIDISTAGPNAATLRRKIKADILKSIGTDITWGSLAYNTEYRGAENEPVDQYGNKLADLRINITITYRTNQWGKDE